MKGTLKLVAALIVAVGLPASSAHAESDFRVTLIGTGIPNPLPDRFGPSTLVEAGGQKLLFDAGRGATIRLYWSSCMTGPRNSNLSRRASASTGAS